MAYRLKAGRSIAAEVRRIADKQLMLAIRDLRAIGDARSDGKVHTARRHVKKVRALTRLVRPALGDGYYLTNRRLQAASRLIAPIADARALIDTLFRIRRKYGMRATEPSLAPLRTVLLDRVTRVDRQAKRDRVLEKVLRVLRAEQARVPSWTLNAHGFRAVSPGLEHTIRQARRSMKRAEAYPTLDSYDVWRRRVKDVWLQTRLLKTLLRDGIEPLQRRLELLDGCLGECHNVMLIEQVVLTESLVSRQQTARALRLLRREHAQLRRRALLLGHRVFREKPRRFVRRIKPMWDARVSRASRTPGGVSWARAA